MVINDELSQKIVLIVDKEIHLEEAGDGFFLKTRLLKDRKVHEDYALNIGGEEGELVNIPSAFSLGSGFFIAENIIATAAHVPLEANRYKNISIDNIRFIDCFCYPIKDEMKEGNDIFIPKDRIFKPMVGYENLPSFEYTGRGQDWAFIPVETISGDPVDHTYIKPDFKPVTKKDKVTWFGHPLGLPVATIKDNKVLKVISADKKEDFFEIENLAYAGLSGAPVIRDGNAVGIIARGMGQLEVNKNDKTVKLVQPFMQQFEGVECQKLSTLEDELNMLKNELEKAESLEVVS